MQPYPVLQNQASDWERYSMMVNATMVGLAIHFIISKAHIRTTTKASPVVTGEKKGYTNRRVPTTIDRLPNKNKSNTIVNWVFCFRFFYCFLFLSCVFVSGGIDGRAEAG